MVDRGAVGLPSEEWLCYLKHPCQPNSRSPWKPDVIPSKDSHRTWSLVAILAREAVLFPEGETTWLTRTPSVKWRVAWLRNYVPVNLPHSSLLDIHSPGTPCTYTCLRLVEVGQKRSRNPSNTSYAPQNSRMKKKFPAIVRTLTT